VRLICAVGRRLQSYVVLSQPDDKECHSLNGKVKRVVSSANKRVKKSEVSGKSLTNINNKIGPSTEP